MGGARANNTATGSQATISRPSVTLPRWAESRASEPSTRTRTRELALLEHHFSIHQHVLNADRCLMWLLKRRAVDHARRIEDRDVRVHARTHEAAVDEADALRCERRHLPHREFERHEFLVAHVAAQDAGKRAVGAGVRALFPERPVGRDAAGVSVHGYPPLLHGRAHVRLAHEEVDGPAAPAARDDQLEEPPAGVLLARCGDFGQALPL